MSVLAACATFMSGAAFALDAFPGTTLTGSSGSVSGSNVGLSGQTGEPQIVDGSAANIHSFWYSWTAPASGRFTMGTCNLTSSTATSYDTTLGTYTGAAVNALTAVTTNDDTANCFINGGAALGSTNTFAAVSGTTYRFRVDGFQALTGNYTLYWALAALTVLTIDGVATEGTDTASFTVVPVGPPAGGTNISVAIGTSPQCTFAPATLTFTPSNWNVAQTVTVTPIDDAAVEGTHSCTPAAITATNGGYSTTTGTPPVIVVNDNENPVFSINKAVNAANITAPGTLTYTITIDNTGNAILTAPVITDAMTFNGSPLALTSGPTLTSGDSNSNNQIEDTETWVYTATATATQAHFDGTGNYSNTATFDTLQTASQTSAAAVTTLTRTATFTIGKVQSSGPSPITLAGQTIGYTVTVTNTGTRTLTVPAFTDTLQLNGAARTLTTGPTLSGDVDADSQLDVGEIWSYAATYLVPQSDIDGIGNFTNVATFDTAQTALSTSNIVTTNVTRTPSFTIVKAQSGGPNPITAQGQAVTYLITIQNTGNQSLTGLAITDTLLQAGSPRVLASGPSYSSGDTDSDGSIDVSEIWLYGATYAVSLSDMNNGGTFSNTASLDTTQTALQTSAAVTTTVTQTPLLTMTKNGTYFNVGDDINGNGLADAGDLVTYQYTVSNGGNVTITNVSVADIHNGVGSLSAVTPASVASLQPGANTQFSATYVVQQGDVDAQ